MDPITQQTVLAAAGAGAGGDKVYVDDVFSTTLYDGTEAAQSITTGIDNTDKSLIFIHARGGTTAQYVDPALFDTERGVRNMIRSNGTGATLFDTNSLTSFNNNGFTTGASATTNSGTADFVAWNFKAAPGFFDVVTYTGDGTSTQTINHSLGSIPGCIIFKNLDNNSNWFVYHRSATSGKHLVLNDSGAELNDGGSAFSALTSTSFTFDRTYVDSINTSGVNFVAYIFAHDDAQFGTGGDESIIKCGTYAGTGADLSVDLGFEPQWILVKKFDGNTNWVILDNMRGLVTGTGDDRFLSANSSDEEQGQDMLDITPTGFIAKANGNTNVNSKNFIYMAIRRPHKPLDAFDPPLDATDVFAIDTVGGTSPTPPWLTSGFVTDFVIRKQVDAAAGAFIFSRLQGPNYMKPATTAAESTNTNYSWDFMNGFSKLTSTDSNTYGYMFKRAPGFMDVVAYSGTGSATTINHNLAATPSVVLIKGRNTTYSWYWQHYALGANTWLQLNNQEAGAGNGGVFNSTLPTSSVFSVGSLAGSNGSGNTYIAYLFADLPGISKAGTFTGTGNNINVDCGFTSGARFVLIKRTDGSGNVGDWYVWDTARGINSGNDPYFLLNDATSEVTNTDYIDPLSSGFTVTSSAPAALNVSGGTYLFLAIA